MRKKVIGFLCLLIAGILSFGKVNASSQYNNKIKIGTPVVNSISRFFQCSGTIEGDEKKYISPSQTGTVGEVYVSKGQCISQNDVLFTIVTDEGTKSYYAPFDGICGLITIQKGQIGIPELSFVQIISSEKMVIRIRINEKNLSSIQEGQIAKIELKAFPGKNYWGVVKDIESYAENDNDFISKILNQSSTTAVTATIEVDELESDFIPGLSADVTVVNNVESKALLLPCSAILHDEIGDYVYEIDKGKIIRTDVEKGDYRSGYYVIYKGITNSKNYVLNPDDQLKEGDCVILNE